MAIETRAHERMATKAELAATEARLMAKIAETNEKINASERRLVMWAIGIAASSVAALGMLLYRLLGG